MFFSTPETYITTSNVFTPLTDGCAENNKHLTMTETKSKSVIAATANVSWLKESGAMLFSGAKGCLEYVWLKFLCYSSLDAAMMTSSDHELTEEGSHRMDLGMPLRHSDFVSKKSALGGVVAADIDAENVNYNTAAKPKKFPKNNKLQPMTPVDAENIDPNAAGKPKKATKKKLQPLTPGTPGGFDELWG